MERHDALSAPVDQDPDIPDSVETPAKGKGKANEVAPKRRRLSAPKKKDGKVIYS
jgi:hypothetical protein